MNSKSIAGPPSGCSLAVIAIVKRLRACAAWRARWKSKDVLTLALYGVHSHVQQVPIYLGQLQYRLNRKRGKRAPLVEYKQV